MFLQAGPGASQPCQEQRPHSAVYWGGGGEEQGEQEEQEAGAAPLSQTVDSDGPGLGLWPGSFTAGHTAALVLDQEHEWKVEGEAGTGT